MCVAAASPPLLVPTALSALCVLMRLGCMDLSDAWAAVNGPVPLSSPRPCGPPRSRVLQ